MKNVQGGVDGLQSIQLLFHVLSMLKLEGLPANLKDVHNVDVYAAPGIKGDDWKVHLNDQGQAWIITPLHYSGEGLRIIRKASGGGTWDARHKLLKKHGDAFWHERKYKLVEATNKQQATNERTGHLEYTMIEYLLDDDKTDRALCRITVNKNNAHVSQPSSSQQPEIMEISHTDANKSGRCETSMPQEPMQQSDNFENATQYHDLPVPEGKVCEHRHRQNFSDAEIRKRKTCEPRTYYSDADLHKIFSRPGYEKKRALQKSSAMNTRNAYSMNPINNQPSTSIYPTIQGRLDHQMVEPNAHVQDPNKSSHNFNANCTEPTDNGNNLPICNQPSTTNYATIESSLDHQMVEPNADVQEPNNLSYNFNAISTQPMDNCNYHHIYSQANTSYFAAIESWLDLTEVELSAGLQEPNQLSQNFIATSTEPMDNQNRIVPNPSTSIFATTEGRLDHQDPDNAFVNFNVNSMEGMENSNQPPSYNQNTIVSGPSTSNHATTVPENVGSYNIFENLSSVVDLDTDVQANPSFTRSLENDTTRDGPYWDESSWDSRLWKPWDDWLGKP